MGKRKSSKKPTARKKAEPLSSVFKCLFCNHEKAVSVKLDKSTMFGSLNCKTCGQRYTTPINNLSVAVDVYCDWVDACEEVRAQQPPKERARRGPSPLSHGVAGGASFDPEGGPHEDDADALGEIDEDVGTNGQKQKHRDRAMVDEDEDEDEDDVDDDDDGRGGKRRRVADFDEEDEEDED